MTAIIQSSFVPAWWLKNPNLQTIWPTVAARKMNFESRRERIELPDGDFLDIDWVGNQSDRIVLILHGLGGSIKSPYAIGILNAIQLCGWQGIFMHFRSCSGEYNRLSRLYHSGETTDLDYILKLIVNRFPNSKISVIGYSLGGNVLLKWLGENSNTKLINCAVAVSVPFELRSVADRMRSGISRFYQWWLLSQLKIEVYNKYKNISSVINLNDLNKIRDFWDFDNNITAPLHGFLSAEDYYMRSSSRQYLKYINVPTLIIHAVDDPFMSPQVIPDISELSRSITFELSKNGGHVGFISGAVPGRARYWLEERIPQYLKNYL